MRHNLMKISTIPGASSSTKTAIGHIGLGWPPSSPTRFISNSLEDASMVSKLHQYLPGVECI